MELKFDKEMDAILRRARADTAVSTGVHPDADAIAAFVENAVPNGVRRLYVEHFADCSSCRKLLSQTILINEATAPAASEVAETVVTPPLALTESWVSRLFKTPGLALGMGALVVVFAGLLGFLVIENRDDSTTSVSKLNDKAANTSLAPYAPSEDVRSNSASAATDSNPANMIAGRDNSIAANSTANGTGVGGTAQPSNSVSADSIPNLPTAKPAATVPQPSTADTTESSIEPPPPRPVDASPPPVRSESEVVAEKDKADDRKTAGVAPEGRDDEIRLARKRALDDTGGNRSGSVSQAPKTGPNRSATTNEQQQMQSKVLLNGVSITRSVGTKSFGRKNGVWYDLAYHGQSTRSIKRGSDKYKKLDAGIRSTVEALDGPVVIVWGSKAYKIY